MVQPSGRHLRVGVDKDEPWRRRGGRAGIHLRGPSRAAADDLHVAAKGREPVETSVADPVGHDDFEAWIRRQAGQQAAKRVQIIDYWDYQRNQRATRHSQSDL